MEQKVVVHFLDGKIVKGITHDFDAARGEFHLLPTEGGGVPTRIELAGLKAVFFVRDFLGNRSYDPPPGFGPARREGRSCIVTFADGEVIFGSTAEEPGSPGFFLKPSDPADNNARIWVCHEAVKSVELPGSEGE